VAFSLAVAQSGLQTPYDDLITAMAGDASTIALVKGIIATESQWNPNAINPADPSYGLMQILAGPGGPFPSVSPQDLLDPSTNITLGVTFIQDLLRRYGSPDAIAAYNAGTPRRNSAGQYVNSRGDTMVQAYVDSVLTYQTWYLNAMLEGVPSGGGGGWVPTADILRGTSPEYDASLTVTAFVNDLFGGSDAPTEPYIDEWSTPSPAILAGSGLALAVLAIGAIWLATRTS